MKPIKMEEICYLLGISYPKEKASFEIPCPECGKSMNVSFRKEATHCFHCGFSSGKVDFYAHVKNISHEQAVKEIGEWQESGDASKIKPYIYPVKIPELVKMADCQTRHEAYTALLEECSLLDAHKKNLEERGLSEERIGVNGYKSVPVSYREATQIVRNLLLRGIILDGVPGFYKDENGYHMVLTPSGFYIPVRGCGDNRRIQSLQIRFDNSDKKRKYRTFSSSKYQGGAETTTFIHYTGGEIQNGTIYLTEGPLKADIAHELTKGSPFMALTGVSSALYVPQYMKAMMKRGVRHVVTCFDMDQDTNDNVRKSVETVEQTIREMGLSVEKLRWMPKYKGIDDILLATFPKKTCS